MKFTSCVLCEVELLIGVHIGSLKVKTLSKLVIKDIFVIVLKVWSIWTNGLDDVKIGLSEV